MTDPDPLWNFIYVMSSIAMGGWLLVKWLKDE